MAEATARERRRRRRDVSLICDANSGVVEVAEHLARMLMMVERDS